MTVALAGTLVFSNALPVLADDPVTSLDGEGHNEGKLPEYPAVTSITLPTVAASSTMFNYIIDPNGLISQIAAGDGAHYGTKTFKSGDTLYFENTGDNKQDNKDYSAKSDKLSATNNSARDIDLTVTATASLGTDDAGKDVSFATSTESFGTDKELFIAVEGSTVSTGGAATVASPAAISGIGATNAAKLTMNMAGNKENYQLTQSNGTYSYTAKSGSDLKWTSANFNLNGACNTSATWGNETLPKLTVTWSWVEHADTVTGAGEFDGEYTAWLNIDNSGTGKITDSTKVTSVKIGQDGGALTAVTSSVQNGWITVPWASMRDKIEWKTSTINFQFVYDGTTYVANISVTA